MVIAAAGHVGQLSAQVAPYQPPPSACLPNRIRPTEVVAPTPRAADGHPDFTGIWGERSRRQQALHIRRMGTFEPDQAVMQRGAGWNKPLYKPEYGKR